MEIELLKQDPHNYKLLFHFPHAWQGRNNVGMAAQITFLKEDLEAAKVGEGDEVPTWLWLKKLKQALYATALEIEMKGLDKPQGGTHGQDLSNENSGSLTDVAAPGRAHSGSGGSSAAASD